MFRNLLKWGLLFLLSVQAFGQQDRSIEFVAKAALQTAKSKNFQDLTENLFSDLSEREEVMKFLKKHQLLKRSLPDIIAEGPRITIKERSSLTTLDFSQVHVKKLKLNGQTFHFAGQEKFTTLYQAFKKNKKLKQASSDLPILALVALTTYAKASLSLNSLQ